MQVVDLVRGLPIARDRALVFSGPAESVSILANAGEIKQVLLNLTLNAMDAVKPQSGEVKIVLIKSAEQTDHAATAKIKFIDNGVGMTQQTLEHIFEPFFTLKRETRLGGTGLGLSISNAIIEDHHGKIIATSAGVDQGSEFVIELPICVE